MTLADLRALPLLGALNDMDLARLRAHTQWVWHQPGETIVEQGQPCTDLFLIISGQVELVLPGDMPTRLALLEAGDFFGELAALTGDPAPATALSRDVTTLLRLSSEGFMLLLEAGGQPVRRIVASLSARVGEAAERLHRAKLRERSLADHIARQGARRYPEWVGSGPWSQRVRAAISRGSRTLDPVVFVGETGTGKELAAARLHYNSLRKDGPFIALDGAGMTEQAWHEAVRMAAHGSLLIKRADLAPDEAARWVSAVLPSAAGGRLSGRMPRLLATAGPAAEREPSPIEELILDAGYAVLIPPLRERTEDIPVLVRSFIRRHGHPAADAQVGQPISAEALRRLASFPFRSANVRELEKVVQEALLVAGGGTILPQHLRLERHGTAPGRPRIGLALGGGAIRGSAHAGVIRAFEEAGIPIDCVAGTSAGSLVGALYAGGLDGKELCDLASSLGWMDVAELAWPRAGFLTSRRMRAFLDRHIGPVTFDQLRVPFAAVAADANTGNELVLRQGRVADAVRGSTAIPGVFQPVEVDGRLLVDGVVVNNVPAGAARSLGADVVIAVDVTEYGFAAGPPRSFAESIMRAFDIMARQTITPSLEWADLVIRPQITGLNGYKSTNSAEFVRRGYAAAREAMPAIRAHIEQVRRDLCT